MTSDRKVRVLLTFDVEDPITPVSDDALLALLNQLSDQGAAAAFFLTGDKTRALRARGRTDVFAALQRHDVGYHTDRHSVHPTVAEYLEHTDWEHGVDEVVAHEMAGADLIRDTLGRELLAFASAGTSWGPQIAGALAQLGVASHVHSFSRTGQSHNPHWYAGSLCFARDEAIGPVEDLLLDETKFRALLDEIPRMIDRAAQSPTSLLHLYIGHPTSFVNSQFWDALNYADGKNPPPGAAPIIPQRRPRADTIAMFARLRHLVDVLQADDHVEITPLRQVVESARTTPAFPDTWLDSEISYAAGDSDIRTTSSVASPAQLLHAMCAKATGTTAQTSVRELHGPVTGPLDQTDSTAIVTQRQFTTLLHELLHHTSTTATLPGAVHTSGVTITLGTLYRTLVTLGAARELDPLPAHIALSPGPQTPGIATDINRHYCRRVRRWLHKPDLDVTDLCRLTAAQTWSLHAAAPF